jgi:Zn-dependent protease with chaperone function
VLDDPQLNASVYADTISVNRGLLDSPWLTPVLAHEFGHLESLDGRILAALYRLTTPPRRPLRFPMRALGAVATGELATWLMLVPWRSFWRAREYDADAHAARLEQGPALADFLQINALDNDLPTPFPWLSCNTHPPTEYRIERLHQISEAPRGHERPRFKVTS